jgi:hypothetical protein
MAVITVTEILGGDNLAGSRITINDNFKKVTNAINTLETRLDTSFVPGGSLNVGNAIIRRYTNPTSAQIFDCEATGQFQGNLNVLLDASVTQSISAGLDVTAGRNVNFTGSSGSGSFLSAIFSEFNAGFALTQLGAQTLAAPTLDPNALTPLGATTRSITSSLVGYSVLRLDLSTYITASPTNCEEIVLPAVGTGATPGQIITIVIDQTSPAAISGGFKISNTNFDPGYNLPITIGAGLVGTDLAAIKKVAVTLFADASGWRVLNVANANPTAPDVTY